VRDWTERFGEQGELKHMRDEVVEHCAKAASLEEAVDRACLSRRPNGKLHNHQSRVHPLARGHFAVAIKVALEEEMPATFDRLYNMLEHCKPAGIGPVTVYDVATRVAAYMRLDILTLYLHANVKISWEVLMGRNGWLIVPRQELPKPFKALPTDEVEDLLCGYLKVFQQWSMEDGGLPHSRRHV